MGRNFIFWYLELQRCSTETDLGWTGDHTLEMVDVIGITPIRVFHFAFLNFKLRESYFIMHKREIRQEFNLLTLVVLDKLSVVCVNFY